MLLITSTYSNNKQDSLFVLSTQQKTAMETNDKSGNRKFTLKKQSNKQTKPFASSLPGMV